MCMGLRDTDNIMDEHVHITIMCIQCKHIITSRSESDQQRKKLLYLVMQNQIHTQWGVHIDCMYQYAVQYTLE